MAKVYPGRWTAVDSGDDVTVFLIGMRFNMLWKVPRWLPVFLAMPRMLAHIGRDPEVGMLGMHLWFGRTTVMVTYWRSPEHLRRFAADTEAPHLEPWRAYMRDIGASGDVGIWHETYKVAAADREVVYANMPEFGLAKAIGHERIAAGRNTAKQRMRSEHTTAD